MESKLKLDAFTLKIIAIIAMTCNHIAHGFKDYLPIYILAPLYVVGGLTFPIMAFLLIEGYHKTRNIKRYMLRLLFFGLIALVPFAYVLSVMSFNILITLLLGLICLYLNDNMKNRVFFWVCFVGIVAFTIVCDWSIVGVLMIFMFGRIKNPKQKLVLPILVTVLVSALVLILLSKGWDTQLCLDLGFAAVILCAIPLLNAYNGERGYSPPALRYMFYIYYPAHLIVIGGIRLLMENI